MGHAPNSLTDLVFVCLDSRVNSNSDYSFEMPKRIYESHANILYCRSYYSILQYTSREVYSAVFYSFVLESLMRRKYERGILSLWNCTFIISIVLISSDSIYARSSRKIRLNTILFTPRQNPIYNIISFIRFIYTESCIIRLWFHNIIIRSEKTRLWKLKVSFRGCLMVIIRSKYHK